MQFIHELSHYLVYPDRILNVVYAVCSISMGYLIAKHASHMVEKSVSHRISRHHALLLKRALFYSIFCIFLIMGLQYLGFKLSLLLGAAGVFTVALSFASQTAISNLISGIFLLFEHPFKVGDTVEVNGTAGIVESIDLLSTKLRTSDNKLVRFPNEVLIKSEITNLSYFKTRRLDILLFLAYNCDISKAKALLLQIADQEDHALKKPAPSVAVNGFVNGAIELTFMVWVNTSELAQMRSAIQEAINRQFKPDEIGSVVAATPSSVLRID